MRDFMPDAATFSLFLAAAAVVAVTPGRGIYYVLTRSLKGGRGEGFASTLGNPWAASSTSPRPHSGSPPS